MHESKHFNCILAMILGQNIWQWLPPVHQEARQVTDWPQALNATDAREFFPQGADMMITGALHTSACYVGPDTNKTNLYARMRPNMSTAALNHSVVSVLKTRDTAHRSKNCV
jgi:hypothetical protein